MPILQKSFFAGNGYDAVNEAINSRPALKALEIPVVTNNESLQYAGQVILSDPFTQNLFTSVLVNRIALTWARSKSMVNKLKMFKKGLLERGETIQEIQMGLLDAHGFEGNDDLAENIFSLELPDIEVAYHNMNCKVYYTAVVSEAGLQTAFLSETAMMNFIMAIIHQINESEENDEFLLTKYMIMVAILDGVFYPITTAPVVAGNMSSIVAQVQETAYNLGVRYRTDYNTMGMPTITNADEIVLLNNSKIQSLTGVEVWAKAFNIEYTQFLGKTLTLDMFGDMDWARLTKLWKNITGQTLVQFTPAQIATLNNVHTLLIDEDFFMIFDNLIKGTSQQHPTALRTKYFEHRWKTFSYSPFVNAIAFTSDASTITSVTVSPATATVKKGATLQLTANVVTTGLAKNGVTWRVVSSDGTAVHSSIDQATGLLHVASNETATSLIVTASSTFDTTKYSNATITVSAS